jgi:ribosomal protein S18 acetylase RimI-like enzyme
VTERSWNVRRARPHELAAVGELTVHAYLAGSGLDPASEYVHVLADAAARDQAGAVLVVVDADEAIVGTVTVCPHGTRFAEIGQPGETEFRFLAVAPDAWGVGVGEALIEHLAGIGSGDLVLVVIDDNAPAHRFYLRLGFERLPERDFSPMPGVRLLAYRRGAAASTGFIDPGSDRGRRRSA